MGPMVYALGRKGAKLIGKETGEKRPFDNQVTQLHLQHALMVSDVMEAFERLVRNSDSPRLQLEDKLNRDQSRGMKMRWSVTVRERGHSRRVGLVPDRVFALDQSGERMIYLLEADRGTMPVCRRNFAQTSMRRKFFAYVAAWEEGLLTRDLGATRCRVLMICTSGERLEHLRAEADRLPRGRGLFVFADLAAVTSNPGSFIL